MSDSFAISKINYHVSCIHDILRDLELSSEDYDFLFDTLDDFVNEFLSAFIPRKLASRSPCDTGDDDEKE